MRQQLISTLGSSWVATGLVLIIARFANISDDHYVVACFMVTAILAPVQIILGEIISPIAAKNKLKNNTVTLFGFLIIQFICVSSCFIFTSEYDISDFYLWIITILACGTTAFSSYSSWRYILLLTTGSLNVYESIVVGALPGLTNVFIYSAYFIGHFMVSNLSTSWILIQIILPAYIQNLYLSNLLKRKQVVYEDFDEIPFQSSIFLYIFILVLLIVVSQILRQYLYEQSYQYGIYTIACLNLFFSFAFTLSKLTYLEGKQKRSLVKTKHIVVCTIFQGIMALGVVKYSLSWLWGIVLFFLTQILVIVLIQEYRYRYDLNIQKSMRSFQ